MHLPLHRTLVRLNPYAADKAETITAPAFQRFYKIKFKMTYPVSFHLLLPQNK